MSLPSEQNWLVLHHLITDLTKKGYEIPDGINLEMGLIRSTISSYKRDPSHPDLINGLANAEMSLNPDSRSKFLANTPPGLITGRINLRVPLAEERVQEIAEWNGLIIEFEDDVTVQLHGDKEDLQHGLKEMGSFFLEN